MRHHSGIFLPFLSHNSAAILLKKRQKPAQKHVSNILRKNFKQLLKFKEWSNKLESGEYKNFVHTNVDCDYPKFGVAFEWMPDNGVPRVFYCMVERHVMPVQLYYGLYKFDTIDDIDKFFFKKLMSVLENEDSYADRYRFITQNPKQYFYRLHSLK